MVSPAACWQPCIEALIALGASAASDPMPASLTEPSPAMVASEGHQAVLAGRGIGPVGRALSPWLLLGALGVQLSPFTRLLRRPQGDRAHTILLLQHGPNKNSRTFMDYETVIQAMDGEGGTGARQLAHLCLPYCAPAVLSGAPTLTLVYCPTPAGICGMFERKLKGGVSCLSAAGSFTVGASCAAVQLACRCRGWRHSHTSSPCPCRAESEPAEHHVRHRGPLLLHRPDARPLGARL